MFIISTERCSTIPHPTLRCIQPNKSTPMMRTRTAKKPNAIIGILALGENLRHLYPIIADRSGFVSWSATRCKYYENISRKYQLWEYFRDKLGDKWCDAPVINTSWHHHHHHHGDCTVIIMKLAIECICPILKSEFNSTIDRNCDDGENNYDGVGVFYSGAGK